SYIEKLKASGSSNLVELIIKLEVSVNPLSCPVYDASFTLVLDIAKQLDVGRVAVAVFFTQSCAAIAIYCAMHLEMLDVTTTAAATKKQIYRPPAFLIGLLQLVLPNLPSLHPVTGQFHPVIEQLLEQFSNIKTADCVLFNLFDKLEEVFMWLKSRAIGPTVPSIHLEGDTDYAFSIFNLNNDACMIWLNANETRSLVSVSFGSSASLNAELMSEMVQALRQNGNNNFLLPVNFVEETSEKELVVTWCLQLEMLAHQAVGCSKHIASVDFFCRSKEVMLGERRQEITKSMHWKELAETAVDEGGCSDESIHEIVSRLVGV
ncbi:hypothetical protein CISIN_1g046734mg, partial [Citrus sinensis]